MYLCVYEYVNCGVDVVTLNHSIFILWGNTVRTVSKAKFPMWDNKVYLSYLKTNVCIF